MAQDVAAGRTRSEVTLVRAAGGIVLRDAGPSEMLGHVLALIVFAIVLVWASVRRVSKMTV